MKRILIIIVIALAIPIGGYFGYGYYQDKAAAAEEAKKIEEIALKRYLTDTITTNLATSEFAIVQFAVEMEKVEGREQLDHYTPEVRAAVISTMTSLTREDVQGPKGLETLETMMQTAVQDIVPDHKVVRVMVTEFKVQ